MWSLGEWPAHAQRPEGRRERPPLPWDQVKTEESVQLVMLFHFAFTSLTTGSGHRCLLWAGLPAPTAPSAAPTWTTWEEHPPPLPAPTQLPWAREHGGEGCTSGVKSARAQPRGVAAGGRPCPAPHGPVPKRGPTPGNPEWAKSPRLLETAQVQVLLLHRPWKSQCRMSFCPLMCREDVKIHTEAGVPELANVTCQLGRRLLGLRPKCLVKGFFKRH